MTDCLLLDRLGTVLAPLSVVAEGAGPGLEEALAGLRLRTK